MPTDGSNFGRGTEFANRSTANVFNTAFGAGLAWLDLWTNFQRELQRASFQSFSSYSPTANTRISGSVPQRTTDGIQIVPVGEERLNVATRTVPGEVTRVRRRVISQPVEQQVTLRDEKVVVERRRPTATDGRNNVLTETVIEVSDSRQVPTVWKSLHVAEEVVLRKQVTERTERVRETVRRDVVDVEHEHEHESTDISAREIGSTPVTLVHGGEEQRGPAPGPAAKPGEEERRALEEVGEKKAGPGQPQPPRKA